MTACPFLSPFLQIEFTFVLKNQKFLNVNRRGHYRIFFRDSSSPFGAKSIKEVVSHFFSALQQTRTGARAKRNQVAV